jgi:phage terminase large subunit
LQRLTTSQIAELNLKHANSGLIIGDSAEPRLIHEIRAKGCNVKPSIKGQGSVTYGISLLQDYDLVVSPDSTNLIKELNNYRWLERKSNTPVDAYCHLIDAIRYAVGYQLQNPNRGKYIVH